MAACTKDYSEQTAATGIAAISSADPNLNGIGSTLVFTAGELGAIVRSVIIKATAPTTAGMVRIFLVQYDDLFIPPLPLHFLYREVPIPIQPQAPAVPVPTPMYTMFETTLVGGLKLQAGDAIYASTQNAEPFNVFVEAANWAYPGTLPDECCNFEQQVANTGTNTISVANPNLNGTGTMALVFNAGAASFGSVIKRITIKALQSTHEGVVRLYIGYENLRHLMREVWIPQTTQSSYEPSFKHVIDMDFYLQQGHGVWASTQNAESFAITVEAVNPGYPI